MFSYENQCQFFRTIFALMFAAGLVLPIGLAFAFPEVSLSPSLYSFLQISGLAGIVVFWIAKSFSKTKTKTELTPPFEVVVAE